MLNFTVGPVMSSEAVLAIGSEQVPYFRTSEFSDLMLENERLVKQFAKADDDARVCFVTGSGTASMEATVMNMFTSDDRVIVVNGGSFGHRFVQLCQIHGITYSEINPPMGCGVTGGMLAPFEGKGYSGFLVNLDETSTGVLYDIELISEFCRRNGIFLVVDSISSFLCDPFDMRRLGVKVMITGSQKALAVQPGISVVALSPEALKRVEANEEVCMYLSLKEALKNQERGQTPFTPAVTILLQINKRLKYIYGGGLNSEREVIAETAHTFREGIKDLPLENISESPSNAVTALRPAKHNAREIFATLKDEYGIWICPNGGEWSDTVFRVGHIGHITSEDNQKLIDALHDLNKRGIL